MSGHVKEVNKKEIMLENILAVMSRHTFSRSQAARIVGGEKVLLGHIASGAIECVKPAKAQNGKWFCNAAQVLLHCRNTRPTRNK